MIKLKLSFGKEQKEQTFDILQDELLNAAVERALEGVPKNGFETHEMFVVTVNGLLIEKDFWAFTKLKESDTVIISPKLGKGESGQLFKQAAIIAISIVASVYLGPQAGYGIYGALAVAAITVGATLILNALIPPPVPSLGEGGRGVGSVDNSQMYSISGQSNGMRRLGIVPKVYGGHRMFPSLAAVPYTELAVDPDTGETVQYLYAIYDFGLGVVDVTDIKIGDTPLTTDSFRDFQYRLVDPNRPDIPEDEYDERLEKEFSSYSTRRVMSPLSLSLNTDGTEFIQFSDENPDGDPQEIILDFAAPSGLFGYSSNGSTGERRVILKVDFALVGTSDWKPYNDINFVDSFTSVGGNDVTDFTQNFADLGPYPAENPYYVTYESWRSGSANSSHNFEMLILIRPGTTKLLVENDSRYEVGAKVFYHDGRVLGVIQSIATVGSYKELTLDRIITHYKNIPIYKFRGRRNYSPGMPNPPPPGTVIGSTFDLKPFKTSRHEPSAAVMRGSRAAPVYGNFRFTPKVPGQYQVRVRRDYSVGDYFAQKADAITWQGITTAYKILPVQTTKRHCFLELKIKATNQLNGHIQNLSAIVASVLPVYNPDTQTWSREQTSNPAWIFCDLLTGEVNKKPVPVSRLHLPSILEWAEYCDEIPTPPPSATYLEPRFRCNFILDYETTLAAVLQQVGSTAQASLNIIDGKYGVLIDRFKEVPVQIFTPRNSRDFASTRLYGPRPHGLRVKYIDPQLNWEVAEIIVYDNGYSEANATDFDDLTAFACTNYEQAWRFGRYMLAQNKLRHETISLLVDFENLVCTRGDYVQITQDVMRVGGTPARVKEVDGNLVTIDDAIEINPDISYGYVYRNTTTGEISTSTLTAVSSRSFEVDGDVPSVGDLIVVGQVGQIVYDCIVKAISPNDDMSALLTLVEKADEIFEYESTDVLPEYDPQISDTSRPDFYPPKAVTNLLVTDNFWECNVLKSGYNYYIELVWDIPFGSVYEFFEVWVNDGRGYRMYDTTTSKLYRYDVDQTRLDIEHGFKVVAVSARGNKLELIAMPEVLATPATKTTAPSDVPALNMSITNQVLQLSWEQIDDCDVREYVLRYSPDKNDVWESSVPLMTAARDVNSMSVQARTGVYFLKAIDFNGNQSLVAAKAMTTIPNLFDLNIIETMNEAPDFDGTLTQVERLGEALILQEAVPGDINTVQYYDEGFYEYQNMLDLGEIYTIRLQSQIRADGLKKGELMSDWESLDSLDSLNSSLHSNWDVSLQYRATDIFAAMSSWAHLYEVDQINFGAGVGFTEWRDIPTVGDATGRIFQFRVKLASYQPNVTPRLFDATVKADMPDRIDSFENMVSHPSEPYVITYDPVFKGPAPSPNVQISIDDAETGDYWTFDYKTLEGLAIRIYDKNNIQVSRQFDLVAKGYGRRHTSSL